MEPVKGVKKQSINQLLSDQSMYITYITDSVVYELQISREQVSLQICQLSFHTFNKHVPLWQLLLSHLLYCVYCNCFCKKV